MDHESEHKGVDEDQSDIMENIYNLIDDREPQEIIIKELKKIKDIEKEDYLYRENEPETGILSTLAHKNMYNDTTGIISYIVNRKDVSSKYVDNGFIWACRRVEDGPIFAILESGKVSMYGLRKGIKELKIERSDKRILKKLAQDIVSKISLKLLQKQDTDTRRKELTRASMKLGLHLPMEIKNYILKDFLSNDVEGIKKTQTLKKTMTAGSKYNKRRSNKTRKSYKKTPNMKRV